MNLYEPMNITSVRFMVREIFNLCESLIIKEHTQEEKDKIIKNMYGLLESIDHSKWNMESF